MCFFLFRKPWRCRYKQFSRSSYGGKVGERVAKERGEGRGKKNLVETRCSAKRIKNFFNLNFLTEKEKNRAKILSEEVTEGERNNQLPV